MQIPRPSGVQRHRGLAQLSTLLIFGLTLAACGGAPADAGFTTGVGPGSGSSPLALEIVTTSVPAASLEATYASMQLSAVGAAGPVTWALTQGALPAGMALTSDGLLFGTPLETGFYTFTVACTDGVDDDTQTLGVSVDAFGAVLASGLRFGDAWSNEAIVINFSGATGTPSVAMPQNGSGGSVVSIDMNAGTITYRPGSVYATQVNDLLRITDPGSSTVVEIPLIVRPDPLANHIARFGATDVWKVDFNAKSGSHAFATDWHQSLARLGLRNPASTGVAGSEIDRLSDMVCRTLLLRHLNSMFLRNPDGSGGAQGLAISFPYEDLDGYGAPAPGGYVGGQPYVYNVMALGSISSYGLFGSAFIDSGANAKIENNAPGGPNGPLGVFVNRITDYVEAVYMDYGTQLTATPVNAGDREALKALLHSTGSTGGRYAVLEYMLTGLARSVAAVTAHEIGHSLGLSHTGVTTPGSIMNYSTAIDEQAQYIFLPIDFARLQVALPGPGRGVVQALKAGGGMPEGGLCVCE